MKFGIIGLPESGKTTLFNALSGAHKDTTTHFGVAGKPNLAMVKVPDYRMELLNDMFKPKKFTPATIEYVDLGVVFAESEKGQNLLAMAKEMDGLILVVRLFKDDSIPHPNGSIDPKRDLENINADLLITDLGIIEKRIKKLTASVTKPTKTQEIERAELELLRRCKDAIDNEHGLDTVKLSVNEEKMLKGFTFLSLKPKIVVLNVGEDQLNEKILEKGISHDGAEVLKICAKLEMELANLEECDRLTFQKDMGIEELARDRIIRASTKALGICYFFTVGPDEVKAWETRVGDNAVTAAGKIHTDIAKGFIRAETVSFEDLKELGSMKEIKAKGRVRLEGKDYIIHDGDIINFRFNI